MRAPSCRDNRSNMALHHRVFFACLVATTLLGVCSQNAAVTTTEGTVSAGEDAEVAAAGRPNCPTQRSGNPQALKDVRQGCVARVFFENGCLRRSQKCPAVCGSNEESRCGGTCEPSCRDRRPRCPNDVPCSRAHCDCIQGFFRNDLGLCVRPNQCDSRRECLTDVDCKDGLMCNNDRCTQRVQDSIGRCSQNNDCRRSQACVQGRCLNLCFRNNDCARNEFCDDGKCSERRNQCRTNSDCSRRQTCDSGRCVIDRFAPSQDEEQCGDTTCLGNFECMKGKCVEMVHSAIHPQMDEGSCMIDDDCQMDEVCIALACGPADSDISNGTLASRDGNNCRFDRDCRPGQRCFNDHCEDRFDGCEHRGCPVDHFCSRDRCLEQRDDCRRDRDCRRGEFCFRGRCRKEECRNNGDCDSRAECIRNRCVDRRFSFRLHIMCIEQIDCDAPALCISGACRIPAPKNNIASSRTQCRLDMIKPGCVTVTCSLESDCIGGKTCVNGKCVGNRQNNNGGDRADRDDQDSDEATLF